MARRAKGLHHKGFGKFKVECDSILVTGAQLHSHRLASLNLGFVWSRVLGLSHRVRQFVREWFQGLGREWGGGAPPPPPLAQKTQPGEVSGVTQQGFRV